MLQQILKDLYVDPELLSGLDDQQKQSLFCKMREEQVRRWTLWDQKIGNDLPKHGKNCKTKKTVSFLKGNDGEPWVWVMGEHTNDKSIEDIINQEAIDKARKLAEQEAEQLRKQMEVELKLSDYIDDMSPKIVDMNNKKADDIYCSVDELRNNIPNMNNINNYTMSHYQNKNNKFNVIATRDVLNEKNRNTTPKVAQKVALWEQRLTEERTCEIFQKMQKKQMEVVKEAEEAEKKQEHMWIEQERKAKEAEQQIREIARRAREEHRLTNVNLELETAYSGVSPGVPPGRQAVLDWYRNNEIHKKAGLNVSNNLEPWFHGLITRLEAERLLLDQTDGSFLVRLSERVWGYAISYRAKDKCKHYLVNANQHYCFLGHNQIEHKSLGELITHHKLYPLSGGEKLLKPCPRESNATILELFANTTHM